MRSDQELQSCGSRIRTDDLEVMSLASYRAAPSRGEVFNQKPIVSRELTLSACRVVLSTAVRSHTFGSVISSMKARYFRVNSHHPHLIITVESGCVGFCTRFSLVSRQSGWHAPEVIRAIFSCLVVRIEMSQAEYQNDSATPDVDGPPPIPPPPPTNEAAESVMPPVPPPPPPRSTLPPVAPGPDLSSAASPAPVSGVGSAKGVRWRGELDNVAQPHRGRRSPHPATNPHAPAPGADDEDARSEDRVTRTAPPWLISTVFHLILLLILALITSPAGESLGRVLLTIGQSDRETPVELAEFSINTEDAISSDVEVPDDDTVDLEVPDIFDSQHDSESTELSKVDLGIGSELIDVRPMFNGRTGAMKKALLAIYGGTTQTQDAVALGLAWLKRNQLRDGSWSMRGPYEDGSYSENKTAATAMALIAFLGDGNTHLAGEYRQEVERGVKYLLKQQDRRGAFENAGRRHEMAYAQAQATIALCELYGMTKDSWLRPRAQVAADYAVYWQSPRGGWRYQPKSDSDTSVTGWFVMALKSAQAAELEVDTEVFYRVSDYLDTAQFADGAGYSYQAGGRPSTAMTAEGLLCRQYLGWSREFEPMVVGVDSLVYSHNFNIHDRNVYYWYYATQTLHHFGGEPWMEWNRAMRKELPEAQVRSGRERGSWAPDGDQYGDNFGRLYTTCLSIYCLEVYYRHMPLYQ